MVLLKAVEAAIEKDPRFRTSLPPGFNTQDGHQNLALDHLSELLDLLFHQIDLLSVLNEVSKGALNVRQPSLDGHLLDLEAESQVSLSTRLHRRPGLLMKVILEDDQVCLFFHGKVVRMPASIEREIRFICEVNEFTGADLPGDLDDPGKVFLIRKLLHEGFLTMS